MSKTSMHVAVFHVLSTLGAGLAQKVKCSQGFYTARVLSLNLALLGKQYFFEVKVLYEHKTPKV